LGRRNARRVHLKIGVALKNSMPNSAAAVTTAAMATPESAETLLRPGRRSSYFHSGTCSMWLAGLARELRIKTRADETRRVGKDEGEEWAREMSESSRGWQRLWLREGEVDKAGGHVERVYEGAASS